MWLGASLATGHYQDGRITDTGLEFDLGGVEIHEVETDELVFLTNVLSRLSCMADYGITPVCWNGMGGVRYIIKDWRRDDRKIYSNAGTPFYAFFESAIDAPEHASLGDLLSLMYYLAGASAIAQCQPDGIMLSWDFTVPGVVKETVEIELGPDDLRDFLLECLGSWSISSRYRQNQDIVHLKIEGWSDRSLGGGQ